MLSAFKNLQPLLGDLHNHCAISYGHGSLETALANAREQLDFVSITGHAHWPDMPPRDGRIDYIIDFHERGFAKLKAGWPGVLRTLREANAEGEFVVFPGFEIHSCADGDRNVVYKDLDGPLLYPDSIAELHQQLLAGGEAISQPHHLGYRAGTRGIRWGSHFPDLEPFVEMVSMHGCSESSEPARPFLHSMGPSDWESTIQFGLAAGHRAGFSGGTDHHSGHPGSYGHGRTLLWGRDGSREAIWDALKARRMAALTGDRILTRFQAGETPMGGEFTADGPVEIRFEVEAAGALDYVDLLKNNRLVERFWEPGPAPGGDVVDTKLYLEAGWGERGKPVDWEIEFGLSEGEIELVEPRFRGREVVSPVEGEAEDPGQVSKVVERGQQLLRFVTETRSNPNNSTNASQGVCLHVRAPRGASVLAELNGKRVEIPLERLIAGAYAGRLGEIDSPAYRFHRAPLRNEWDWRGAWVDERPRAGDFYYLRARQTNDQWAWASPVFVR